MKNTKAASARGTSREMASECLFVYYLDQYFYKARNTSDLSFRIIL